MPTLVLVRASACQPDVQLQAVGVIDRRPGWGSTGKPYVWAKTYPAGDRRRFCFLATREVGRRRADVGARAPAGRLDVAARADRAPHADPGPQGQGGPAQREAGRRPQTGGSKSPIDIPATRRFSRSASQAGWLTPEEWGEWHRLQKEIEELGGVRVVGGRQQAADPPCDGPRAARFRINAQHPPFRDVRLRAPVGPAVPAAGSRPEHSRPAQPARRRRCAGVLEGYSSAPSGKTIRSFSRGGMNPDGKRIASRFSYAMMIRPAGSSQMRVGSSTEGRSSRTSPRA